MEDLTRNAVSAEALLVLVAMPRLRALGFDVPDCPSIPHPREHELYDLLEQTYGDDAHSRYNALIRRIVSFAAAMERASRSAHSD